MAPTLRLILSSMTFLDYGKLLIVAVVTAVLYHRILLRRRRASFDPPGRTTTSNLHNSDSKSLARQVATNHSALRTSTPARVPRHLLSPHVAGPNGQNVVQQSDGCVAFLHTKAAATTTTTEEEVDRTTLFRRLLQSTTTASPPKRGSTVIIAIPHKDADCPKLPDVLVQLGTYYNTFLILVLPNDDISTSQQRLDAIATLRGQGLSEEVIPTHRILASTTVEGRIAFIRQQLSPTASSSSASTRTTTTTSSTTTNTWPHLILDFDPRVQSILARFGYEAMVIYHHDTNHHHDEKVWSGLGRMIQ